MDSFSPTPAAFVRQVKQFGGWSGSKYL